MTFLLAFDFGGTKVAIATATAEREILERVEISTTEFGDGVSVFNRALNAGEQLVRQTKEKVGGELVGVGVATMGITRDDGVLIAPNVPGWEHLKIPSAMAAAFAGVPVRIDNDVKAAALAEVRRGALQGKDFGIYVNMGTGIALALTLGDRVLQGHNGASGEIAYFLKNKHERAGFREGVTPFEDHYGGKAMGEQASKHFGERMTTKELFTRAGADAAARRFIEETLEDFAFHLTNVMISWDPEVVVFGGGMVAASDVILPFIQAKVEQFVPFPPKLVLAHFNRDAGLYGAIELAKGDIAQSFANPSAKLKRT